MKELPALLCLFIMAYVIYLEFKNPKKGRDIFVDISISIIILIVALYSIYEFKFDLSLLASKLYLCLIAMSFFYVGLVFYHEKHIKEKKEQDVEKSLEEPKEKDY